MKCKHNLYGKWTQQQKQQQNGNENNQESA